ncbi:MAG TPA: hypothetical protein DIC42_00780 [Holosporales bacterium]|nr:hypothetical protein [Holosporales bacterium]
MKYLILIASSISILCATEIEPVQLDKKEILAVTTPSASEPQWVPHSFNQNLPLALYQLVSDFQAVMRKHNVPYFFTSGTLLGAVRHGGLIPWDDDADCYMLKDDSKLFEKTIPDLEKLGYCLNTVSGDCWNGFKVNLWIEQHITCIDVFFMDKDEETGEHYFQSNWSVLKKIRLKNADIFPLQTIKFGGIELITVHNIDKMLTMPYGTLWKTHVVKENHLFGHLLTPEDKKLHIASPEELLPAGPFGPLIEKNLER